MLTWRLSWQHTAMLIDDQRGNCESVRILPPRMSDTGFTVSGMIEPASRYDVTVTVDRDGGYLPDPAEFAVAAGQAASIKNASVVGAHTAEQVISVVTVRAADRPRPWLSPWPWYPKR